MRHGVAQDERQQATCTKNCAFQIGFDRGRRDKPSGFHAVRQDTHGQDCARGDRLRRSLDLDAIVRTEVQVLRMSIPAALRAMARPTSLASAKATTSGGDARNASSIWPCTRPGKLRFRELASLHGLGHGGREQPELPMQAIADNAEAERFQIGEQADALQITLCCGCSR